ncbi:hypothetical protein [Halorubrum persicum]|uniref:hypothetical protein n=1 Tax=Halorubrum persicum TaxID=1383844 RepID=UPI0015D49344|nr:hypothetical protein [Halorubrum persicum]
MATTPSVILGVGVMIWLILPFYVLQDAKRRDKNELFWAFLTIIFGIIAVVIYSVEITPYPKNRPLNNSWSNSSTNEVPDIPKQSGWRHSIERHNEDNEPVVYVSDGVNDAEFIIKENEISPYSKVYQRKYGDKWIESAESYLRTEFKNE